MRFTNPRDPENVAVTRKIKEWVRIYMPIEEDEAILVSEINCADPGCADMETMVALLSPKGKTRQFRIRKPLVYVRSWDIEALSKK